MTLSASSPPTPRRGVALVTGGARGIGRAIALGLAADGYDIVIADVLTEEAHVTARDIEALGRHALALRVDVADREQVEAMVQTSVERLGRLDVAVANAARSNRRNFIDLTWDEAWATLSVTLFGVWHTCQFAARQMVAQGEGGKIVIIGSVHAERPYRQSSAYNVAKSGVTALGATLAGELAPHRINVNVIHPGWTDTPGERVHFSEADIQAGGARIPWGRLARTEEIADMARFLCSDAADYITGSTFKVDGGFVLP